MASSLFEPATSGNLLLPVLPLREVCLFPEASLSVTVSRPATVKSLEIAARTGRRLLTLAQMDPSAEVPRELHDLGTIAFLADNASDPEGGRRIELDGQTRARVVALMGADTQVAEVEILAEGDPGDEWGPAVEALARYLHSHAELRAFLQQARRSEQPMSWVNLACQHLPITATARQKLLESDAPSRCLKISRGLDALLRKEQGA